MEKCNSCFYQEDLFFGSICQHKPSMEGTEAEAEYLDCLDIDECKYYIPYKEEDTTYRIERITDRDGNDRTEDKYPQRIGRLCKKPQASIGYCARVFYLENADGSDYSGKMLLTTPVSDIKEDEDTLTLTTKRSVYYFRKEKPNK